MEPTNTTTSEQQKPAESTSQQQTAVPQGRTDAVINDLRINNEWLLTLVLSIFLGIFGVHRFYNGKIGTGILMILTIGGLGIWATIDTIMIIFGKFKKKDGTPIPVRVHTVSA